MSPKPRPIVTLILVTLFTTQVGSADQVLPQVSLVPQGVVAVAELRRPEALLDLVFRKDVLEAIQRTPPYRQQAEQAQFKQLLQGVKFAEVALAANWQTALRRLIGGGVTLAVTPAGGSLLVIDAQDEKTLQ